MAVYRVTLERRVGLGEEPVTVTVRYACETYNEAWVGARTVCRLGTDRKRVFRRDDDSTFEDAPSFTCGPAEYTVRSIFAENTRKKGKKRMMNLSSEQLLKVVEDRKIRTSQALRDVLVEVLDGSDGLRITVATARRLGVAEEEAA